MSELHAVVSAQEHFGFKKRARINTSRGAALTKSRIYEEAVSVELGILSSACPVLESGKNEFGFFKLGTPLSGPRPSEVLFQKRECLLHGGSLTFLDYVPSP